MYTVVAPTFIIKFFPPPIAFLFLFACLACVQFYSFCFLSAAQINLLFYQPMTLLSNQL